MNKKNNPLEKYLALIQTNPELFENYDAPIRIITDQEEILRWQVDARKELIENKKPNSWAEIGVVFEDQYIVILMDLIDHTQVLA